MDRTLRLWCYHLGSYLRPSRPWLQEVVPSVRCLQRVFLRAKPKDACEPHYGKHSGESVELVLKRREKKEHQFYI